jgi:putative ABC transport system permease protein
LLPEGAPAIVVSPRQIGAHISSMVERWRRTSYLQAATVLPLAILAVGGFLTFSILARRHEFSILEALGATPEQIRRCILLEATTLALAGTLLGLAGGALLQMFVLFSLRQSLLGFDLPFQPNWGLAFGLLVAAPVGAMVAAWRPIRAQSREPLARQLSVE